MYCCNTIYFPFTFSVHCFTFLVHNLLSVFIFDISCNFLISWKLPCVLYWRWISRRWGKHCTLHLSCSHCASSYWQDTRSSVLVSITVLMSLTPATMIWYRSLGVSSRVPHKCGLRYEKAVHRFATASLHTATPSCTRWHHSVACQLKHWPFSFTYELCSGFLVNYSLTEHIPPSRYADFLERVRTYFSSSSLALKSIDLA